MFCCLELTTPEHHIYGGMSRSMPRLASSCSVASHLDLEGSDQGRCVETEAATNGPC